MQTLHCPLSPSLSPFFRCSLPTFGQTSLLISFNIVPPLKLRLMHRYTAAELGRQPITGPEPPKVRPRPCSSAYGCHYQWHLTRACACVRACVREGIQARACFLNLVLRITTHTITSHLLTRCPCACPCPCCTSVPTKASDGTGRRVRVHTQDRRRESPVPTRAAGHTAENTGGN